MRAHRAALVAALLASCGDNVTVAPDAAPVDPSLLERLRALPGVTADPQPTQTPGYQYVVLHFTQPVDHADPASATFQQEVSLLTRDPTAPMVVETDGYWDYTLDQPVELTQLTHANQISIEHRYFGDSRPASPDWTKLTIAQMAADEHAIVTALQTIYTGKYVATGASKGGMTAVYYRRFYPDDVAGTVPYVAPLSFGAPDHRYAAFVASDGDPACRQAVRDAAVEMLAHRRAALEQRAQAEATAQHESYTRIALAPAVETAVLSLEWAFWQYRGIAACTAVPAPSASDDALWTFLGDTSPVSDSDDAAIAAFEPYYYQAYTQLGYPDGGEGAYLASYELYAAIDYGVIAPAGAPAPVYDGGVAMHDVDDYVQHMGARLLFLYGQWDPWSGGAFALGSAADSLVVVKAQGTHDSQLSELAAADRDAAFAKLGTWLGIPPPAPPALRPTPRPPRIPPVILRALRARH